MSHVKMKPILYIDEIKLKVKIRDNIGLYRQCMTDSIDTHTDLWYSKSRFSNITFE